MQKRFNYIKKECLLNKRLLIYYFNKRLIFRFNTTNIKRRGILIKKYFLVNAIVYIEKLIIIQKLTKIV